MGDCCSKPDQPVSLVMVGLDSSGKSTVLSHFLLDQNISIKPTIGFNFEEVTGRLGEANGVIFKIWDLGGQGMVRQLWNTYTESTDGILFVVDSTDTNRMAEAKMELLNTMSASEKSGAPILVVANKQDLRGAIEPLGVESLVGLNALTASNRLTNICGASAKTGEGLDEALETLYQMIIQKRRCCKRVQK